MFLNVYFKLKNIVKVVRRYLTFNEKHFQKQQQNNIRPIFLL